MEVVKPHFIYTYADCIYLLDLYSFNLRLIEPEMASKKKDTTSKKQDEKDLNKTSKGKTRTDTKAVKTPTKKSTVEVQKNSEEKKTKKTMTLKLNSKALSVLVWVGIVFFSFVLVDLLVQYLNNDYSVAVVNGSRITQAELNDRLEQVYGREVIQSLIDEELVITEAREKDITVSQDEIDAIVSDAIAEYDGEDNFNDILEQNSLTLDRYEDKVKIILYAQKLAVEEPTEDELKEFFEQNKETYFVEGEEYKDVEGRVLRIYNSVKYREVSGPFITGLREDADIQNNIEDEPSYGFLKVTQEIIKDLF